MKHLILFSILVGILNLNLNSQTCINNPSIQQESITLPITTNGTGSISFTYFENLLDYTAYQNDPITITVCFLNMSPIAGASSVNGSFSHHFNWLYDPISNCLQGTQNQTIFGGSGGLISVDIKIDNPVLCPSNQIGFNANIQPAACMQGINETIDDTVSEYTCFQIQNTCKGRIVAKRGANAIKFGLRWFPASLIQSYHWDFGDGNTSSSQFPIHSYSATGTYQVNLIITTTSNSQCAYTKKVKYISGNLTSNGGIQLKDEADFEPEAFITNQLELLPNPASNNVQVNIETTELGEATLSIMSVTGQTLYSKSIELTNNQKTIDLNLSNYESGVYFIVVRTSTETVTKKLVKN